MLLPSEPRPPRRRARVAASIAAVSLVVVAAPLASSTVRTSIKVRWIARGLSSRDRTERLQIRERLLAFGRPAADSIFPEVVASAVADEWSWWTTVKGAVFVARRTEPARGLYQIEDSLWGKQFDGTPGSLCRVVAQPKGPLSHYLPQDGAERFLLFGTGYWADDILSRTDGPPMVGHVGVFVFSDYSVVIPLDDSLGSAVVEAVRTRLSQIVR